MDGSTLLYLLIAATCAPYTHIRAQEKEELTASQQITKTAVHVQQIEHAKASVECLIGRAG